GTLLTAWAVLPRGWFEHHRHQRVRSDAQLDAPTLEAPPPATDHRALGAMDDAPPSRGHWTMLVRMYAGLVIDTMKLVTLGFMLPGMQAEYGLSPAVVSLFPLAAVIGLTT